MVMVMTREKDPRPETASAGQLQVVVTAADVPDRDSLQQVLTRLGRPAVARGRFLWARRVTGPRARQKESSRGRVCGRGFVRSGCGFS